MPESMQKKQRDTHSQKPLASFAGIRLKLGWHRTKNESVAMKTFQASSPTAYDDKHAELVEHEVAALTRIGYHRHIIQLVDVMIDNPSGVVLVMEAAAASWPDLIGTISAGPEGRLGRDTARFYFGQLLNAVDHCHSRGVCHRDIQPEHVLVDPRSGNVKLSGFGRAGLWNPRVGDGIGFLYASTGSPLKHAAPEVMKRIYYDGKSADLWGCGVVLFTMLAGVSPYDKEHDMEGGYDRRNYLQTAPGMLPSSCSFLEELMKSDPETRLTAAEVRSHPWFTRKRGDSSGEDTGGGGEAEGDDATGRLRNSTNSNSGAGCVSNKSSDDDAINDKRRLSNSCSGISESSFSDMTTSNHERRLSDSSSSSDFF